MLDGKNSRFYIKMMQTKSKLIEYSIPKELHPELQKDIDVILLNILGVIGNFSLQLINDFYSVDKLRTAEFESLKLTIKYLENLIITNEKYSNSILIRMLLSITYCFIDQTGNSKLILRRLSNDSLYGDLNDIQSFIYKVLLDRIYYFDDSDIDNTVVNNYFNKWLKDFKVLIETGSEIDIESRIEEFKKTVLYLNNQDFIFVELATAVLILKYYQSTSYLLPKFSNKNYGYWKDYIIENRFFELWESQRLIGGKGILKGESAVIQLPTGTGKTRSISIIIKSKENRKGNLFVVVAPFRALCDEISYGIHYDFKYDQNVIVNHLSEILDEEDGLIHAQDDKKYCIVATPEKLMYYLKLHPNLVDKVNTIFFDEAHIFDEDNRGLNFEFLLSAFKKLLPKETQKILLSAIMANPEDICDWFIGDGEIITEALLRPVDKNYVFVDWRKYKQGIFGNLYFEKLDNPQDNFYLPRFIQLSELKKLGNERKQRFFPSLNNIGTKMDNTHDIAIYTSLKLVTSGSSIIFTGKKVSANKILERFLDINKREYSIEQILELSDKNEIKRIAHLIDKNIGNQNVYYRASLFGLAAHHGGIFNGLRKSVEHAFRKRKIPLLICTSTLAQGVNLPIKNIIVSGINQGVNTMKTRDFNNLKGRSGRAGYYTEGTVIFTEPFFYTVKENNRTANYKWNKYKNLITNDHSEECSSVLISILNSDLNIQVEDEKYNVDDIFEIIYSEQNAYEELLEILYDEEDPSIRKESIKVIKYINHIGLQIENYMLLNIDFKVENIDLELENLFQNTLGYYLSNEEEEVMLRKIFINIFKYLLRDINKIEQSTQAYKRTLLGVRDIQKIIDFIEERITKISMIETFSEYFHFVYEFMYDVMYPELRTHFNQDNKDKYKALFVYWTNGMSYNAILSETNGWRYKYGPTATREFCIDDLINISNNVFGYQFHKFLSSFNEILKTYIEVEKIVSYAEILLRRSKFGLLRESEAIIYELGFSDRYISEKIVALSLENSFEIKSKEDAKIFLEVYKSEVTEYLNDFPSYFLELMENY